MDNRDLDKLLAEIRQSQAPPLPGSFVPDVLREIRLRRNSNTNDSSWVSALLLWCRPSVLAAVLTATVTVSLILPGMDIARSTNQSRTASSLDLNIFSPFASNLPSGLLAKVP